MSDIKHNYPDSLFMVGHDAGNGEIGGFLDERDQDAKELQDDLSVMLTRDAAVDRCSGKDTGHHEEGIVAVYRLVEIIEVRQRRTTKSHVVKATRPEVKHE